MNTRQKLTLGIAAIFMVTLTIVGVTYAYFFTRVNVGEEDVTDITASTAKIESISYVNEEDQMVDLHDMLPGATVSKTFKISNPNQTAGQFEMFLEAWVPENTETEAENDLLPSFIHSKATDFDSKVCYDNTKVDSEYVNGTNPADCFTGENYDNITYTILKDGVVVAGPTPVKHNSLTNGVQVVDTFDIAADTVDTYTIKVDYNNVTTEGYNNQNLEFNAGLNIKVDIR